MRKVEVLSFNEFAARYCERQEQTPEGLLFILQHQKALYSPSPDGWMLLECQMMDSSHFGEYTILPYGGLATFKSVPDYPVSPRGLASDMSIVVAVLPVEALPE